MAKIPRCILEITEPTQWAPDATNWAYRAIGWVNGPYHGFRMNDEFFRDVTKSGNGEPGTGSGERESGNECTAVIPIRIQNRLFNAA